MSSTRYSIDGLSLQRIIGKIAAVAWLSLIVGVLLPEVASYCCNVFYDEQVRKKLPDFAKEKLHAYEVHKDDLQSRMDKIDKLLSEHNQADLARTDEGVRLTQMREYYKRELELQKPPVVAAGYHLNPIMPLWPSVYFSLGLLVCVLPPFGSGHGGMKGFFKFAIPAFLVFWPLYRCWTLLRNFVFYRDGRVVYASENYDVSPLMFLIQELMALVVCVLLIVLWYQWIMMFTERQAELREPENNGEMAAFYPDVITRLSNTFFHWQVASFILSFGFIWYSIFFWNVVAHTGDYRYIPHAVIVHLMWAFTWALISSPLVITWYHWNLLRNKVANQLVGSSAFDKDKAKTVTDLLDKVQPIGAWNVVASGFAAVASFFLPIVNSLMR